MLNQLLKYSDETKGKYDIVAAMQMAEIADEEVSELVPVAVKEIKKEFQDIGYYKDEKGYTRYGIIPKYKEPQVIAHMNTGYVEGYNITSDPRYR
jgi:hypothetical protein